ncbi:MULTISPECIES: alpha/beta fold hydrolase [unclassified Streptomyces]|uniref:thioesterase II family protein n=1 Tax=unclassified Streptomyces TaxID=2593676 RepID=UPI00340A3AA3
MTTLTNNSEVWIHRLHPAPHSTVRLVCFPHAGGSAGFFRSMSEALGPRTEVLAVQYPGRQERWKEAPLSDVGELARLIAAALRPWADRPLAFFGHSMGSIVAYEVTRRLESVGAGSAPVLLFASGRHAPSVLREGSVHLRDDDGLIAEMRRLGGTDVELLADEGFLRILLPAVRSDYQAVETYVHRPGRELTCPVAALVGDADPYVTPDEARRWEEHTSGEFALHRFPGGHFYLVPQQKNVIRVISERLAEVAPAGR